MKLVRLGKALGWGAAAGVLTMIGFCFIPSSVYQERFVKDSITEMRRYKDPMQVPDAYTRRFADGSSIAIFMAHNCCSGEGYNVTVVYDSAGHFSVNKDRCFCGYEELASDISNVPAKSLSDFYTHLRDLPLTLRDATGR